MGYEKCEEDMRILFKLKQIIIEKKLKYSKIGGNTKNMKRVQEM